jgi:hypothetical protein
MKITVFWDVAPCSLVDIDQHFRGTYCLHHALMMEAVSSSKISVSIYHITVHDVLEDSRLLTCQLKNLKCYLFCVFPTRASYEFLYFIWCAESVFAYKNCILI